MEISKELDNIMVSLLDKKARRDMINENIEVIERRTSKKKILIESNDKILVLYRNASEYAKQKIKENIESMSTNALNVVYGGNHKLKIDLVERRNRHEVDFYLDDGFVNKQLKKPFAGKGGGKVTMVALALQLAIIESIGAEGIICLDEVTKQIDDTAINHVANFLLEYAKTFDKQLIMVTHQTQLEDVAPLIYKVEKVNGVSKAVVV